MLEWVVVASSTVPVITICTSACAAASTMAFGESGGLRPSGGSRTSGCSPGVLIICARSSLANAVAAVAELPSSTAKSKGKSPMRSGSAACTRAANREPAARHIASAIRFIVFSSELSPMPGNVIAA